MCLHLASVVKLAGWAVAYHVAGCGRVSEHVLRMGRRALMEKEAAARNAPLQATE
jgi:hypothetical protein